MSETVKLIGGKLDGQYIVKSGMYIRLLTAKENTGHARKDPPLVFDGEAYDIPKAEVDEHYYELGSDGNYHHIGS